MGYNGLSRLSKWNRTTLSLPLKRLQALGEACLPINYRYPETRSQASAQNPVPEPSATSMQNHSLLYGVWHHAHCLCWNVMGSMAGKPLIGWGFATQKWGCVRFRGQCSITALWQMRPILSLLVPHSIQTGGKVGRSWLESRRSCWCTTLSPRVLKASALYYNKRHMYNRALNNGITWNQW